MLSRAVTAVLIGLLLAAAFFTTPAMAAGLPRDYVLVIDTSGSMAGKPKGSKNPVVYPGVQKAAKAFVKAIREGTVLLYTFDKGIRDVRKFRIEGPGDQATLLKAIDDLEFIGTQTWIHHTLDRVFTDLAARRRASGGRRLQDIRLYTDGRDNGPGKHTVESTAQAFRLHRGENGGLLYFKYIAPEGKHPTLSGGVPWETDTIDSKGRPKVDVLIEVRPSVGLDLGNVQETHKATRTLVLHFDTEHVRALRPGLRFEARFPEIESYGALVDISPRQVTLTGDERTIELTFQFLNTETVPPGSYRGNLTLTGDRPEVYPHPRNLALDVAFGEPPKARLTAAPGSPAGFSLGGLGRGIASSRGCRMELTGDRADAGATVRASLWQDASSPAALAAPGDIGLSVDGGPSALVQEVPLAAGRPLGLNLRVTPSTSLPPGDYKGEVRLEVQGGTLAADGALGVRAPGKGERIHALPYSFSLQGAQVHVAPAKDVPGRLDFGEVPHEKEIIHGLTVHFDASGLSPRPTLSARLLAENAGPGKLDVPGAIGMSLDGGDFSDVLDLPEDSQEHELRVRVSPPLGLSSGAYQAGVELTMKGGRLAVVDDLAASSSAPGVATVPITFSVPWVAPVWMMPAGVLGVLVLLGLVWLFAFSPRFGPDLALYPVPPGSDLERLLERDPPPRYLLAGREVSFGSGWTVVGGPGSRATLEIQGLTGRCLELKPAGRRSIKLKALTDLTVDGESCEAGRTVTIGDGSEVRVDSETSLVVSRMTLASLDHD